MIIKDIDANNLRDYEILTNGVIIDTSDLKDDEEVIVSIAYDVTYTKGNKNDSK